tara:strand:- start:219 stop:638 length:420 start_codon:yes stop_codon:yes gene_type:complete
MTDILTKYEKPVNPLSPTRFEKEQRNKAILNYVKKNNIPRNKIGQIIYNDSDKANPIRVILKKNLDKQGNIKNKKTEKVIKDKKALFDKETEAMKKEINMDQSAEDAFKELESRKKGGRVKKKTMTGNTFVANLYKGFK